MEGEADPSQLLPFAINAKNVKDSLVMITLDLSQPWSMVASLNKWLKVIQAHMEALFLELPSGIEEELKKSGTCFQCKGVIT